MFLVYPTLQEGFWMGTLRRKAAKEEVKGVGQKIKGMAQEIAGNAVIREKNRSRR
jgi:hypothetical protein